MTKKKKKQSKRNRDSSDFESEENNNKQFKPRGPSEDSESTPVSDILNQTNAVLFETENQKVENDNVFNVTKVKKIRNGG